MYELRPNLRRSVGLAAVAMLFVGCGEHSTHQKLNKASEKSTVAFEDGMRIESSPSRVIIDLCRGNILTREVIAAFIKNHEGRPKVKIDSHGPDPKCFDGVITSQDYPKTIPEGTTTSSVNT